MPLISTTGALAVNKVGLGVSNNYWFLQWNDSTFEIEGIAIDSSNQLFCTCGYQPSGFGFWINLKINQDSGLPIIAWQKRFSGFTNLSGRNIYFNRYNNTIYNVGALDASTSSDNSAGTIIYNRDGTVSGQYIDNNQFYGASSTYPWYRRPDSVISDSSGDYWISGVINEKPNSTTNQYLAYYSKFSGGTKIYSKVLIDASTFASARGFPSKIQFTPAGDLLMVTKTDTFFTPSQNIVTLVNINPVTNTINWQNKWNSPAGATSIQCNAYTQDNTGNIYIAFTVTISGTTNTYLQKYSSAGALIWSRRLNNGATLEDMTTDAYGYVYLVVIATGGSSLNNIIKIDGNYNIQWQRRLTTPSSGKNIGINNIYCDKDNIYLEGGASIPSGATAFSSFIMKLPNDGTIPGTGTYVVSGALTVTYTSNNAITFVTGSPIITSTGTLSIANATPKAYDSISLGANTTINTTTLTNL